MISRAGLIVSFFSLVLFVLLASFAGAALPEARLAEIAVIPVGDSPVSVGLSLDGSQLYVAEHVGFETLDVIGNMSVIDTSSLSVVSVVTLGQGHVGRLRVTPDGSRAYVPLSKASGSTISNGENAVAFIDLASLVPGLVLAPPGNAYGPLGMDLLPDGTRGYVAHRGSDRVLVLDIDDQSPTFHTFVEQVPIPPAGSSPIGVGATPDGARVYVASRQNSTVSAINTTTNTVDAIIPVPIGPSGSLTAVAVAPDGSRTYVTYATDSRLAVIDTDPASPDFHTVIDVIETGVGGSLSRVRFEPDGTRAYVIRSEGQILVLDTDPASPDYHSVLAEIAVGNTPADIVLQPNSSAVAYVPNFGDGSVSVIGLECGSLSEVVTAMDPDDFSNSNHQKTLLNKLDVVSAMIERGQLCDAASKLHHDVLPKTDSEPAPPDWVIDPDAQAQLESVIEACIGQLLLAAGGTCPSF